MDEKYSWVNTHKEITKYLITKEDEQQDLIDLLKSVGIDPFNDKRGGEGLDTELKEIDPFTFFCYIHKYGPERQLKYLQGIAKKLGITIPKDQTGIPTANAQKVWLFPYEKERVNNEVPRLWNFFKKAINDQITNEDFADVLGIKNIAETKLTEALFYIRPDQYFPINGPTKPYLKEVLGINPKFKSFEEYQTILNEVKEKTEFSFYELSHEAWLWSESRKVSTPPDEQRFLQIIESLPLKHLTTFFTLLDELMVHLGIDAIDERLTFSCQKDNRLILIVGGRYCLDVGLKDGPWGFISKESLAENSMLVESYPFKGKPITFYNKASDYQLIEEQKEEIFSIASRELDRFERSNFRKANNNSAFEKAVFDKAYRSKIIPMDQRIVLNGQRLYKVSHGSQYFNDKDIATFIEKQIIVVHEETKAKGRATTTQGDLFLNQVEIGDYFYLCHSNNQCVLIGRIVSKPFPVEWRNLGNDGWQARSYEVIKEAIHDRPYSGSKHWWTPNANSTFIDIPISKIDIANKELFMPTFDVAFLTEAEENEKRLTSIKNTELNVILFGPPGTGKTYRSKSMAVEAIDGHLPNERKAINNRYHDLVKEGQIQFVTFHQSTTYEDFVEGIKPIMEKEEDTGDLAYQIEDGIFKRMCIEAAYEYIKIQSQDEAVVRTLDFSQRFDQLMSDYTERVEKEGAVNIPLKSGGMISVLEISSQGNFILQHQDGQRSYTVSKSRLEKLYNEIDDFDNIPNIYSYFRNVIGGSNASAYWAILNQIYQLDVSETEKTDKVIAYEDKRKAFERINWESIDPNLSVPAYFLVIDEINRGNIAAILGELITLLEEDKRGGNPEYLEVILPYSKQKFSVPPNLYILGTMNTADRSVEALDTALRRRFAFQEIQPDPELLRKMTVDGIDLEQLLKVMNGRIRKLLDKDHMIGHAYFLPIKSAKDPLTMLRSVFHNKILPLLQEYFYGNFGKIQLILGRSFVDKITDTEFNFAADADLEEEDFLERIVYEVKDISNMDLTDFKKAVIKIYKPDYE